MKHAFIRLEKDGAISIRWWVDTSAGVATRTLLHVRPGESAFDVPYEAWTRHDGAFVDLDQVRQLALTKALDN